MPFNLNDFRSQLALDGARPNLFEVEMNLPILAQQGNSLNKMKFMIKSAQLPGSTVGTVPVFYFGRELKFAGNRTFPDWTVTIINDEDFSIRNSFERWMSLINSHAGNERSQSTYTPADYTTNMSVHQYSKNNVNGKIKSYKFVGAFPTDISPIDLDWGSNDAIEEFTVTFSYQWWESNTTDSSGSGSPGGNTPSFIPSVAGGQ
jgi:hypothetical protein